MGVGIWERAVSAVRPDKLGAHLWHMFRYNWHLGFTSFGGPAVHFKIFHDLFVARLAWIDEQIYQELFSLCQAFSGPGSTKMLYAINLFAEGFPAAVMGQLIWSLPGALGMFGLAIGISHVADPLPRAAYALLSGLNAATVGIIALAAVQLSERAITDKATRLLVFFGAAAGMLYNSLWYFPLLLAIAGIAAVVHDYRWLHGPVKAVVRVAVRAKSSVVRRKHGNGGKDREADAELQDVVGREDKPVGLQTVDESGSSQQRQQRQQQEQQQQQQQQQLAQPPRIYSTRGKTAASARASSSSLPVSVHDPPPPSPSPPAASSGNRRRTTRENEVSSAPKDDAHNADSVPSPRVVPSARRIPISWRVGTAIIVAYLALFLAVMLLRGLLPSKPLLYSLFANMLLAGTIIFGGGPVVVPLLREYVVAEGWVSPRDFLIGLAIIQSFPGPNFNFAVYLGALAAVGAGKSAIAGAALGYVGIFLPGLWTVHGLLGLWGALRARRWVRSALRGVNAAAVGLIYTAVYRLWQIGWIDDGFTAGTSLANDPWWVVVTASSYMLGFWFGVSPPVAIVIGAVLGLVRYGVVSA